MNTVFNTQEQPVILTGYAGSQHFSAAARLTRRTGLVPADAERAAALYFAELAALRLDQEFFRREPVPGPVNALVLTLTGETPSAAGADYREFTFLLSGTDEDADRLKRRFALISGSLAAAGIVTISSRRITTAVTFTGWICQPAVFSRSTDAGRVCHTGEMPIAGTVCLTRPEPASGSNPVSSGS